MNRSEVYRTESGLVFRVTHAEGALRVDVLTEGTWEAGRVQIVGLRHLQGTKRLTQQQVDRLTD